MKMGTIFKKWRNEEYVNIVWWRSSSRKINTAWKVSKYGVISDPYFPAFGLSVFSPNAGKYGPEITPYLDTFQAVKGILSFVPFM